MTHQRSPAQQAIDPALPQLCADVAVFAPLPRPLSYVVPAPMEKLLRPGMRVRVPLGRRSAIGVVVRLRPSGDEQWELKPISACLDEEVVALDGDSVAFLQRVSAYYAYPLGLTIKTALPAGLTQQKAPTAIQHVHYRATGQEAVLRGATQQAIYAFIVSQGEVAAEEIRASFPHPHAPLRRLEELGLVTRTQSTSSRDPFVGLDIKPDTPPVLAPEQQQAVTAICPDTEQPSTFAPFLLHGVTGSGKTEVYLHAIAHVVQVQHRQALVLVPEIALTPQLVKRFRARFEHQGVRIGILHSGMSVAERHDIWREINHNRIEIVIGARSAVFAPLQNLGIVVVDEEHDESYKQGEGLRYNARDLALLRGQMLQIPVVLGSATPALTRFERARAGHMTLLSLTHRALSRPMPVVEIVDLSGTKEPCVLGEQMLTALQQTLDAGEQAVLLLNRRGFSPYLICRDCGATFRCPNCDITLTWYRSKGMLTCNYCDYTQVPEEVCPGCGGATIEPQGVGTEQLEHTLQEYFPTAAIARMDRDSTRTKGSQQRLVEQMENREVDILVGTQMVAKGHDFAAVTLVGVVDADAALNFPDFRAAERCFSLLAQVAGRAGRGAVPGRVLVQTRTPDNPVLECALSHDYHAFCAQELPMRELLGYPPYGYLLNMICFGLNRAEVEQSAEQLSRLLRTHVEVEILGPAPCPLFRLRNRYRVQILLKAATRLPLHQVLARLPELIAALPTRVNLMADVDPLDMM
ncbi:MAG: primosomal protein N' [Desulfuromonas sp.]|nr:primosomal protein N' [Desulfuromonas sp.]